jgi:hypothetical protein
MRHTVIGRRRPVRIALGLAGTVVGVLALAQLLLPGLAAQRVRSRVGRYGSVLSVHVSAFPAIELLWGHAESITLRAGRLTLTPTQTVDLLAQARGIDSLDIAAGDLRVGPLALHTASLRKRGTDVYGQGEVRAADLRALPGGLEAQLLESGGGQVRVRASGGLFGVRASVTALVGPSEGKLVAQPEGLPFAGMARVTLFSDPRLAVTAVGLSPLPARPLSWLATLRARLVG